MEGTVIIIHRSHASVTNNQFLALFMPEAIAIVEKNENFQEPVLLYYYEVLITLQLFCTSFGQQD